MKIEIEVKDFWIEEGELVESLQAHVKHDVIQKISASIKTKVEESITKKLEEAMKTKLDQVIDAAMADFVATGIIMVQGKEVLVIDHLKNMFMKGHGWNDPSAKMQEIAKRFGDDLKLQYNNIFATKIVATMKTQGFLKDDMARILLGDDSGG